MTNKEELSKLMKLAAKLYYSKRIHPCNRNDVGFLLVNGALVMLHVLLSRYYQLIIEITLKLSVISTVGLKGNIII